MMRSLLILIHLILCFSCAENRYRKKQIKQLFSTEIILPDTSFLFDRALDTVNLNIPAKMVVYFDAETCASCALSRIWEWDDVSLLTQNSSGKFQVLNSISSEFHSISKSLHHICTKPRKLHRTVSRNKLLSYLSERYNPLRLITQIYR